MKYYICLATILYLGVQFANGQESAETNRKILLSILKSIENIDKHLEQNDERLRRLEDEQKRQSRNIGNIGGMSGQSPVISNKPITSPTRKKLNFLACEVEEQCVEFVIIPVKGTVIESDKEANNMISFFGPAFDNRPIILMHISPRSTAYFGRKDIVNFLSNYEGTCFPMSSFTLTYGAP
ncbi:MAG: hypothetical protein R3B84_14870 [Zavarzinella sp.]